MLGPEATRRASWRRKATCLPQSWVSPGGDVVAASRYGTVEQRASGPYARSIGEKFESAASIAWDPAALSSDRAPVLVAEVFDEATERESAEHPAEIHPAATVSVALATVIVPLAQ